MHTNINSYFLFLWCTNLVEFTITTAFSISKLTLNADSRHGNISLSRWSTGKKLLEQSTINYYVYHIGYNIGMGLRIYKVI